MTNKESSATSDYYCLQISNNSSISCDSELSSLSLDREVETYENPMHTDELPAFEIRLISPLGRTPSPIDSDYDFLSSPAHSCITPTRPSSKRAQTNYSDNEDYVTLNDINAQISPPSETDSTPLSDCNRGNNNLETIFEGVFLNTPPRPKIQRRTSSINRMSLLDKITVNRINTAADKENSDESKLLLSNEDLTGSLNTCI